MDVKASLLGGIKALLAGALVGSALPSFFTLSIGLGILGNGEWYGLALALMPFLMALAGGAIGMLLIGVPFTLYLIRNEREGAKAYLAGGVVGGLLLMIPVIWLLDMSYAPELALMFLAFGMLTGAAIGGFWWRFARKLAQMDETEKFGEIFG